MKCPLCDREWPKDCEQAISIERHGECIVCKFTPTGKGANDGTKAELDIISAESIRRQFLSVENKIMDNKVLSQ